MSQVYMLVVIEQSNRVEIYMKDGSCDVRLATQTNIAQLIKDNNLRAEGTNDRRRKIYSNYTNCQIAKITIDGCDTCQTDPEIFFDIKLTLFNGHIIALNSMTGDVLHILYRANNLDMPKQFQHYKDYDVVKSYFGAASM